MEADGPHCTCPDFELRRVVCKHAYAVEIVLKRETVTETTAEGKARTTVTETAAVRLSYPQNWPAYNRAQTAEKELFCRLLRDLCDGVPEPVQGKGRPRIPLADALFSACFKVYSTASSRRFMTDLRAAHAAGLVTRPWHFNTVLKVIEDESLTPILHDLIAASAAPLKSVESTFAVDSTGFGTQSFYRHYSAKYGHDQIWRDFMKLHALIGTKTNVIAAVTVTGRDHHDSPQFRPLMEAGVQTFNIERVVADKGYSGRENVELAASLGTEPFIAFRSNAKETSVNAPNAPAWRRLFHLYNFRRDDFLTHYHARSNAESTFSSMKRVLGDTLRSKTVAARTNELLFMVIAHNIRCVVHSIFELDVPVTAFVTCTQTGVGT
jgi:transposase